MRISTVLTGAALIIAGGIGLAAAQSSADHGTAISPFSHAAPHEVQYFNGVPCRTMYVRRMSARVPIQCAGDVHVPVVDVHTTGSPFPYAARHEVKMFNGVPCRTMYVRQRNARVPIQCAGDVMVPRVN